MCIVTVHYGCGLLILLSIDSVILRVAFDVVSLHSCFYHRFVIVIVLRVILLLIAIITFYFGFIVTFIVGFHVFWSMLFTIGFINGFHCGKAKGLLTREIHPAECAKRLIRRPQRSGPGATAC